MDSESVAELVSEIASSVTAGEAQISAQILIFYEYALTIGDEITLFWGGKITGAVIVFFANRYLTLAANIFLLCYDVIVFPQSAEKLVWAVDQGSSWVQISQYIVWAAFSGLRVYGVGRSRIIALIVFVLSLCPFIINAYQTVLTSVFYIPELSAWAAVSDATSDDAKHFTMISRIPVLIADAIVIAVMWYKLWKRQVKDAPGGPSFSEVLLRDGTVYFITLFTLNALHLTLTLLSLGEPIGFLSLIPTFTEPLTSILISRFMLNLQATDKRSTGETSSIGSQLESVVFQRVVGSLSSAVEYGDDLDDDMISHTGESKDTEISTSVKDEEVAGHTNT